VQGGGWPRDPGKSPVVAASGSATGVGDLDVFVGVVHAGSCAVAHRGGRGANPTISASRPDPGLTGKIHVSGWGSWTTWRKDRFRSRTSRSKINTGKGNLTKRSTRVRFWSGS